MGQNHGDGDSAQSSYRNAHDVVFLGLRDTVFCTECELISYNNSSRCLACGSLAVLSLARVLGGSLRGQETARVVTREEIHAVVGEVLRDTASFMEPHAMVPPAGCGEPQTVWGYASEPTGTLVPALEAGVLRSCDLTGASGAAVAIAEGRRMVCRARAGKTAPELGVEVAQEGLTALCVRTGQPWRCDDAEHEPWANRGACRALGIRSIVVAPIVIPRRVLGVLEVFSPNPSAFDTYHSATVQLIASALAVAIVRGAEKNAAEREALPQPEDVG